MRAVLAILIAAAGCFAANAAQAKTEVAIAPFVWAPSIRGTLAQGPLTIPLDASARDLASGIKLGGMVHAEARTDVLQISVQAIAFKFHDRQFRPLFGSDVATSLATVEALAGPRIHAGRLEFVPMAGVRHTRIQGTIDAAGLGNLVAAMTWNEGLLGLEARARVAPSLTVRARGTVAVVGPDGQSGADVIVAASYRLSRSVSVVPGYRWARERVLPSQASAFSLDLDAGGPFLGIVFDL